MTRYNPLLAGIVLSIASQGCMSTEYLATTNDLDASESILVTTKSGEKHSATPRDFHSDGSLMSLEGGFISPDSIQSVEISRVDYGKSALVAVGIAGGIYATIRFVELVNIMIQVSPPKPEVRWPYF